jgi:chromosome segregation ATPase
MGLTIVGAMQRAGDFHVSRMCSLSCRQQVAKIGLSVSSDEYADGEEMAEGDSLRARSEQAIGEIAQALIDSPHLHSALQAAFGAREKAIEAQQAAMSALNLPSAGDVERLERRIRSFSQRLEDVEEQLDDLTRELGSLRRKIAANAKKSAESTASPAADAEPESDAA